MEELLDGPLAQRAKALCGRLEESDSCAVAATAALSKPPEGEFERAIQRVARSAGSCEVVSKATHGNTLFTLRRGAEEGMEALAHRADFGKVPPGTARAGPASKKGATLISVLRTGALGGLHNKSFWREKGVTWAAVKAAATGGKESESESEDESRSRSRSRSQSRQGGN